MRRQSHPQRSKKHPLVEALLSFVGYHLRRLSARLFGLAMILGGIFGYICLCMYDPTKSSLNVVRLPGSSLGPLAKAQAITADLLFQGLGHCAWLAPFVLLSWGGRFLVYRPFSNPKSRFFLLLLGFVFLCFGIGYKTPQANALGYLMHHGISQLLAVIGQKKYALLVFSIAQPVCFIAGLGVYFYALAIPVQLWKKLFQGFITLVERVFCFVSSCFSKPPSPAHTHRPPTLTDKGTAAFSSMAQDFSEEIESQPNPYPLRPEKQNIVRKIWPKEPVKVSANINRAAKKSVPGSFALPSPDLIEKPPKQKERALSDAELEERAALLHKTLADFGVRGQISQVNPGPVVTLYEFKPAPGIKTSRIVALSDDIARSMSAQSARVAVVAGKNALGIELPNQTRQTVFFHPLISSPDYTKSKEKLPLILGKDIGGTPFIADLARMPHLLIAGTTGSGKSVAVNTMILSLLYHLTPDECKFIMVDPKMLELSVYEGIPHLLTPVVTNPKKAVVALKWAVREMEDRYQKMSKLGVRNILGYNEKIKQANAIGEILTRRVQTGYDPETGKPQYEDVPMDMAPLPYIVIIVDEMADLMLVAGKEIESTIQRLAQMARAAGIHLIMATQRPSVDVITGTIKANFPTRVSFQVSSKIDSRTILSEQGAEQLLGQGDMLFMEGGGRIRRLHGPFVSDENIEKIVQFLANQGAPTYVEEVTRDEESGPDGLGDEASKEHDPLFDQAVALIAKEKKASTSFIQRHFQIGYNRAARIIDQMEAEGIVSPANHVGRREVLAR